MRYLKVERTHTSLRRYGWIFAFVVAFGGMWLPKLGLVLVPIMATLAVMGFMRGKYWCGNFCPHGSLFDGPLLPVSRAKRISGALRSRLVIYGAFGVFMAGLASRLGPVIAMWGTTGFWDRLGYVFVFNYFVVTVVGSLLALTVNSRAWCSICPMGTFQELTYRVGSYFGANEATGVKVWAQNPAECRECGLCARVCPMQLSPYTDWDEEGWFDDERCIRCGLCSRHCPIDIIDLNVPADDRKSADREQLRPTA